MYINSYIIGAMPKMGGSMNDYIPDPLVDNGYDYDVIEIIIE